LNKELLLQRASDTTPSQVFACIIDSKYFDMELSQVPLVARTPTLMAMADGENHRGTLELTMADGKNDSTILDQGLLDIGLTLSGPEDFPEVGLTASGLEESENTTREIWGNLISIEDTTQTIQCNNRKMEKMRKIKAKKARIATGQ